jgi:phosphoribosylformylglycinamidine synthase
VKSAHDCSDGGIAVALAESSILGGIGLDASAVQVDGRFDAALFGEAQSRIVVSCAPDAVERLRALAHESGVGLTHLGTAGGSALRLTPHIDVPLEELTLTYEEGLPVALQPPSDSDS